MKIKNEIDESEFMAWPFEKALEKLESVVQALEGGQLSLDEAIESYRIGMQLAKICREKLAQAEQKVERVLATEKGLVSEAFDLKEE